MLSQFIKVNICYLCQQAWINSDDFYMIALMQNKDQFDSIKVMKWMRDYGLFQGIEENDKAKHRSDCVNCIKEFLVSRKFVGNFSEQTFESDFNDILYSLKVASGGRYMLSATSKLLWCRYPDFVPMYDSFAMRSVAVLQHLDPAIKESVGAKPKSKSSEVSDYFDHYKKYRAIVCSMTQRYKPTIDEAKKECKSKYLYNLRIMDKALLMLGSYKKPTF